MNTVSIIPENKEHWLSLRMQDITSTEISALFGLSPYLTKFELWHRKKNQMESDFDPNERTIWGSRLESSIAHGIAEENGWTIRHAPEYVRSPEHRLGSSFDFMIQHMVEGVTPIDPELVDLANLEIKNVDFLVFRDNWNEDSDLGLEAPPHIELQVQQQMMLGKKDHIHIGVLVGGNKKYQVRREADPEIHEMIKAAAAEFWQSIENNTPPSPDFVADFEFIKKIFSDVEPGKIMDARGNNELLELAKAYKAASEVVKGAEEVKDSLKAQILMLIGDNEKVIGEGFSVTAGITGEAEIAYTRPAFRNFRVNWSKKKEK